MKYGDCESTIMRSKLDHTAPYRGEEERLAFFSASIPFNPYCTETWTSTSAGLAGALNDQSMC